MIPDLNALIFEVNQIPDFAPEAELAKAACMVHSSGDALAAAYRDKSVGGYILTAWRAKIVEARLLAALAAMGGKQ